MATPAAAAATHDPLTSLALAARTRIASGAIQVPAYPAIVGRLQAALVDERAGARDISRIVSADPVLTAMVLARSGSVASGRAPTTSLDVAITRLGGHELLQLALASSLGKATAGHGPLAGLRRGRWQDALLSAGLCKLLAARRGIDGERAYLAGLLHDFGALVVIACIEDLVTKAPIDPQPIEAWARVVEGLHLDAAVHVAHVWKLPDDLAQIMAEHHDISARTAERPMLHLVWDVDRAITALTNGKPLDCLPACERDDVSVALPTIVEHITTFQTAMPTVASTVKAPSAIAPSRHSEDGSAVDFVVATTSATYRGDVVWLDRFQFDGVEPLRPDWLAELVVSDGTDGLEMLAYVRACRPHMRGFVMVGQPFGLAGDQQATWVRMVARARNAKLGPR